MNGPGEVPLGERSYIGNWDRPIGLQGGSPNQPTETECFVGDRLRVVRWALGVVAMAVALSACSGGSDDGDAAPAVDSEPTEQVDSGADLADEATTTTAAGPIEFEDPNLPIITLLDPGAEPRQELRFDLADGTEETSTVGLQVIEQLVDGEAIVPPQPIETITDVSVSRRVVDGGVEIVSEITDARLGDGTEPELAEFVSSNFVDLIGVSTTVLVDDRGFIARATTDAGASELVADLVGDAVNQSNPLPEEAIGVGGAWVSETSLEENGITIVVQTTSTVREFTEDGVILDVEMIQQVAELGEEVNLDGVEAVVDVWDVSGQGTVELDFTRFSPVALDMEVSGAQGFTFEGAGSLEQRLSSETTLETLG